MFTVAVLAQKGGVGKTTLSLTLAHLAAGEGYSAGFIDGDPSRNAHAWAERRARLSEGRAGPPVIVADDPDTLRAAVDAARADGMEWLFIDTGAGVAELPALAAQLADFLLIPCAPTANAMKGIEPTARLARRLGKPAFFVVNKGRTSRGMNDQCAVALTSLYGLPAAAAHITLRLPIGDCEDTGLTLPEVESRESSVQKGKDEFAALWRWLKTQRDGDPAPSGKGVTTYAVA
jgi:chromosome partitioning protein